MIYFKKRKEGNKLVNDLGTKALSAVKTGVKNKIGNAIVQPINSIIDQNLTEVTTTIGSFIVRSIRGKFQRSITFNIGASYSDRWMEEALYGILYQYNDIKGSSRLELANKHGSPADGSGMYCRLDDGTHNLKYRNYNILLCIQSVAPSVPAGVRMSRQRVYTIITYDLSPEFVTYFEKDMIAHRNSLLKIQKDSPTVNVYQDCHESDGYTYWEKTGVVNKRKLSSIYLPYETKRKLVDTINNFFVSKEFYTKHGIAHNLKILLYGPPGTGKDSIAKMIASEWNRNIYYITGGKDGRFIPNAITDNDEDVNYPLMMISDIDKFPFLINEPDLNLKDDEGKARDETMRFKQAFGAMINALDGVVSSEDRIIIMTTNHIEKFSETFTRPGRIDLQLEIGYVTPDVFRQYVFDIYGVELPKDIKLVSDDLIIGKMQFDTLFSKLTADEFIDKYVKKGK